MALIIAIIVVVNTYPLYASQELMTEAKRGDMLRTANIVSSSLSGLQSLDSERVDTVMSILSVTGSGRLIVTDQSGLILFDSAGDDVNAAGKYLLMAELVSALAGNDCFRCRFTDGAFESVASVPVIYRNQTLGAVFFYEYDSSQGALLISMQSYLRNMSLFIALVTLAISTVIAFIMRRRISRLVTAISNIREGNYKHRAPESGHDEIAIIAREFNELSGRLEKTEEIRRQFVSNASHELKTPLASIKLLTDSILQTSNMKMEDIRDFLEDINQEIVRLTRITECLLTLTRLDVGLSHNYTPVNVSFVVRRAARMVTPLASQRHITVECDTADNCYVKAEEDGLYQVIFNLMENAVKYNKTGGRIHALTYIRDELVYCIVDDTGVGIPPGELQRIFDRFYRVDKARSRETGGTGLGLSIVKTTVEQFGGKVWAENKETGGSRFIFTIPAMNPEDIKLQ